MRQIWLGTIIFVGMLIAGCTQTVPPTLSPSNSDNAIRTVVEPMQINEIGIVGVEQQPPVPGAVIAGIVGDSCSELDSVSQFRDGNTISIQINVSRTTGPTTVCAELAQVYNDTLPLEGEFPPGDYTLLVNGSTVTFTIVGGPACTFDSEVIADVTSPPGSPALSGRPFVKTWRIRNSGNCAWDSTYVLVQINGDLLTANSGEAEVPLPTTLPGTEVEISVEMILSEEASTGSQHAARFQLRTPAGELFGAQPFVQVTAVDATAEDVEDCVPDSEFVSDVTIPDGSPVAVGIPFVKTWRIRNIGTCTWTEDYDLVLIRGDEMLPLQEEIALPITRPGETIELSMTLELPPDTAIGKKYETRFRLRDPDGRFFGVEPFVQATAAVPQ